MKIKLVVYSEDIQYVEHLVNYLNIHYSDTVELNVFDEEEALKEYLDRYKADIILLDDGYNSVFKSNAITVYLTNEPDAKNEQIYVFKYQKGELIYKTILNIYASGTDKSLHNLREKREGAPGIHMFLSVNGGAGASTVAKAYGIKMEEEKRI